MVEESSDDNWLLRHWRLVSRSGAVAIAIGLWAAALDAGGDMTAADPLLAVTCVFSIVNLATFAELSKLYRVAGSVGLAIFFAGTWAYIKWTHPAGVSDSFVSDWFHAAAHTASVAVYSRPAQFAAILLLGVALGYFGPREYRKAFGYRWYSSYDIFKLADQKLLKDVVITDDEVQQLAAKISALGDERQKLGLIPSPVPHATSEALAMLQESIREASARNFALHELRERARAGALQDVYEKLQSSRLIARGFVSPVHSYSKETIIPAGHWRFIKFKNNYTEASNNGTVRYVGISVARKSWF